VGLLGPALGGGHGRFEGQYGLISDNFINLNVVLASGEAIKVNATSHADLFWAMQGAGHNFGIVTSFEMKIYPRLVDTWHYHNYVWSEDKLETVFEELNKFHNNGSTPVLMAVNFGEFSLNTTISTTKVSDSPLLCFLVTSGESWHRSTND
jgi:FAD/FMN-containing dehydrogenase